MNVLSETSRAAHLTWLRADPGSHLLPLGALCASPDDFLVYGHDAPLAGVAVSWRGVALPYGDALAVAALAGPVRSRHPIRMIVGVRDTVDAFVAGMGRNLVPRVLRDHRRYVYTRDAVDRAPRQSAAAPPAVTLRLARARDLDAVVSLASSMESEELPTSSGLRDDPGFRRHVARLIREGRAYLGTDERALLFNVFISVLTPDGAELEAITTQLEARRRGVARSCLGALAETLFESGVPRVSLHVHEANGPAVALYESLGFQRGAAFRLTVI